MVTFDSKDFTSFIDLLKATSTAETGILTGYRYQEKYYVYIISKTPSCEVSHKQTSALIAMNLSTPGATYLD